MARTGNDRTPAQSPDSAANSLADSAATSATATATAARKNRIHWSRQGKDPDYRFTLANERTFLAWIRTALAILAGALVIHQVAARIEPHWVLVASTTALAVLSAILSGGAYRQWKSNEIAMRTERSLPLSPLIPLLAAAVALLAAIAIAILATH